MGVRYKFVDFGAGTSLASPASLAPCDKCPENRKTPRLQSGDVFWFLQGYLAHKKPPPPQGPPQGSRRRPSVGSWGEAVSSEQGSPVCSEEEGERGTTWPNVNKHLTKPIRMACRCLSGPVKGPNCFKSMRQPFTLGTAWPNVNEHPTKPIRMAYRGTLHIRNCHTVGPYSTTMPRLLWRS
jgi:hypothetical protein